MAGNFFINMPLFASDKVILEMKNFIQQQDNKTLNDVAIAMRKDLYGIKTTLKTTHLILTYKRQPLTLWAI
jgi:hypothetical protein